jgi:hypothetical protein
MPSDHGRGFDEYQGIGELRSHSVEPHPEQTAAEEGPNAAGTLPPENDNLMSRAMSSSSSDARLRTRNESGATRVDRIVIMHPDGMAVVPEIPQSLSTVHSFE